MADFFDVSSVDAYYRLAGVLGFCAYVCVYTCLTLRLLNSDSIRYFAYNTCAATLVLISLSHEFNLASALIQIFWIVLGVIGISLRVMLRWQDAMLSRR
ncbi:MAG: CBU_0592 family membrane protein [Pelagimonas sp.]|uniref:CBU_0592 family membrane protein n=1 Tax=Pelagimonas sp. TaxID=2073170 RepID=UPI003D6AF7B3